MVPIKEMPEVVSREEWLAARKALLAKEKEHTRAQDALNAERRRLPMVRIDKDYVFDGARGKVRLVDLFEGRRQLILKHFMFGPTWDKGCPSCSATSEGFTEACRNQLHGRDTTLAVASRAPLAKIDAYKKSRGWTFPWYSSFESDFNYDFHVTLDETVAPLEYAYRTKEEHENAGTAYWFSGERPIELPGLSCFLRDGETVFHTYSTYARGAETTIATYHLLDLTALGRQEVWEEPKGRVERPFPPVPSFATERL